MLVPETLVAIMLKSLTAWNLVSAFASWGEQHIASAQPSRSTNTSTARGVGGPTAGCGVPLEEGGKEMA